jgi:hypothetical protein
MVGLGGIEPATSPLSGERSNRLSYRPGVLRRGWDLNPRTPSKGLAAFGAAALGHYATPPRTGSGEGGIRTREPRRGQDAFRTSALGHYATPPRKRRGWDLNP